MAICKECIHFEVCKNATIPNPEYKGIQEDKSKTCKHFKSIAKTAKEVVNAKVVRG